MRAILPPNLLWKNLIRGINHRGSQKFDWLRNLRTREFESGNRESVACP
jgi:hypothetical protein